MLRRKFLIGATASLLVTPAIVQAANIMPVKALVIPPQRIKDIEHFMKHYGMKKDGVWTICSGNNHGMTFYNYGNYIQALERANRENSLIRKMLNA